MRSSAQGLVSIVWLVAVAFGLAALSGCESGWDPDTPETADGSGTWQGLLETDEGNLETGGALLQEGDHLTGSWDGLAVSGSIDTTQVTLVNATVRDGAAVTTTLVGNMDGGRMAGTVSCEVNGVEVSRGTFQVTRF